MSKEIESKVVSMEFDNSQFDKPAKESMSTIEKLKEALNFKGVENGMNSINKAIKAVTFDPMIKGVDTVYAKFTAFERFTIQLYDRLANSIINTTTRIGREIFTIPVSSGKSEYELKMGSIQTIMASTGETLEKVDGYLDELNKYSDDTIYSFSDMTNNIGKFTNAGVKLEDAVAAIKGVSNEAALSGATANEASRAMYNFAQALSSGAVKLIDWKSIENANMATVSFKEELINTAVALGTLTEAENGLYKTTKGHTLNAMRNFNETLSDAWLTSDVLITTLKKYSDSSVAGSIGDRAQKAATEVKTLSKMLDTLKEALQSGWAESWQLIIGDFEQAKELWTGVSNVLGGLIGRLSDTRNAMLKTWSAMGGRLSMIQAFSNIWKSLTSILGTVKRAFNEVIPPMTGKRLATLTRMFENFTAKLRPSNETLLKFQRTFRGFFSIFGIGIDAAKALFNAIAPLFGDVFKFGASNILGVTASLGDWIYNLRQSIKEGRVFETFFGKIATILATFGRGFKRVFNFVVGVIKAFNADGFKAGLTAIKDGFANLLKDIWAKIKEFDPIGSIKKLGIKIAEAIYEWPVGKAVVDFVRNIKNTIVNSSVWKFCVSVVEGFINTIQNVINKFRGIDTSATEEFTDNVKKGFGPLEAIKNFFTAIWHGILAVWDVIGPALKTIGSAIGTMFQNMWNSIKTVVNNSDLGDVGLFNAGTGLGAMMFSITAFIKQLSSTVKNASETSKGIKKLFGGLLDVLRAFRVDLYSKAIKDVAISIGILAASLFVISALPAPAIARATGTILLLFRSLTASVQAFSTVSSGGVAGAMASVGAQILAIGAAVGVLVASMVVLALLPYEGLLKGLAVIVLLMRAITAETKKLSEVQGTAKVAGVILAMGIFLQMLLVPLSILSLIAKFNAGGLWMAATVIIVLSTVVTIVIKALQESTSEYGDKMPKIAGTFVAMMLSLSAVMLAIAGVAGVVALLSKVGQPGAFAKAAKYVITIVGVLAALAVVLSALPMLVSKFQPIAEMSKFDKDSGMLTSYKRFDTSSTQEYSKQRGGFGVIVGALLGVAVAVVAITGAMLLLATAASLGANLDKAYSYVKWIVILVGGIAILCMALSKASMKLNANASFAIKDIKTSVSLLLSLASYAIAFSLAIVAVAASAKILEGVKLGSIGKAMLVIAGITVFIGALAALSAIGAGADKKNGIKSFGDRFSSGLMKVAKAAKEFAKIALIFAGAVAIIVGSIAIIMKSTDSDIKSFVKMIEDHKDEIVNAVKQIAEIALTAALNGLFVALKTLTSETILGLNDMLDTLIDQAPQMLSKIFILIGQLLDGIAENADWILDKLVVAVLAVMDGLATAIDRHKEKILDAFERLIQAISDLWVKGIGRMFGIPEEYLDIFSGTVGKATTATVIGVSAISKAVTGTVNIFTAFKKATTATVIVVSAISKAVTGTVNTFTAFKKAASGVKTLVTKLASGIDSARLMWMYYKDAANLAAEQGIKFADAFAQVSPGLGKLATFVSGKLLPTLASPIGIFGAIAIAGGVAARQLIKSSTEAMQVITYNDQLVSDNLKSYIHDEQELKEAIDSRRDAYEGIDKEWTSNERILETLRECVDENGKIKAGYETRFSLIRDRLNGVLNVELDAETGIVSVIDAQNNKLEVQSQKIDEIMKKRRLQAKMEQAEEKVADIREKLEGGYYAEQEKAAIEAEENFKKAMFSYKDASGVVQSLNVSNEGMLRWYEEYKALRKQLETGGIANQAQLDRYRELEEYNAKGWFIDALAAMEAYNSATVTARQNTIQATAYVKNVDKAWAAMDGSIEEIEAAMSYLNFDVISTEAGATIDQVVNQFEGFTKEIDGLLASGAMVSTETKKRYSELFNALAKELGDSPEGRQKLHDLGYSSGDTWLEGWTDRINAKTFEPLTENDIIGTTQAWTKGKATVGKLMADVARYGASEYKKANDQHSPSKVYEQLGVYDVLGLINGVTKKEGTLGKAYSAMATANVAAYTAAMSKQTSGFAWSPLVNTSGFQNGINTMQSQFANLQNGALNTGLTTRLAASVDMTKLEESNRELNRTMVSMRQDFAALSETLQDMQIVLDDGTLVGRLAPALDAELGRRTARRSRGV